MKLRVVKRDCWWYVVSDIYEPPSPGKVGSGVLWCAPHRTKALAMKALKEINQKAEPNRPVSSSHQTHHSKEQYQMATKLTRITPTQAKLIRERLIEGIKAKREKVIKRLTNGEEVQKAQAAAQDLIKKFAGSSITVEINTRTVWRDKGTLYASCNLNDKKLDEILEKHVVEPLTKALNKDKQLVELRRLEKEVEEALFLGQIGDESAVGLLVRLTAKLESI